MLVCIRAVAPEAVMNTHSSIPTPRPHLVSLAAYVPGEQLQGPGIVKLNTNEFPYPPAPEVVEALRAVAADVRRYPDPTATALRERLAALHAVLPDQIFVGNGSDEVLRLLAQTWIEPGRRLAIVRPTYTLFEILAAQCGVAADVYPLEDAERLPEALFTASWDLCFLPVPNPPLGTVFPDAALRRLAGRGGLLVLDEAYIEFADPAVARAHRAMLDACPNVVLTRTFSKSHGLAGMRIGYAVAHPQVIAVLHKLRDSYNVNRASQAAALAALAAAPYYRARCDELIAERGRMARELAARGFLVHAGQGNFVFARLPAARARAVYEALRARRILVRYFALEGLDDGLRVTIGTPRENAALLAGLDALAREGPALT
jgi:histidinol-phosphate aminotransferase